LTAMNMRLAGRAELMRLLGVSRTRAVQISDRADFPAPVDVLSMGNIWALDDVITWAEKAGRKLDLDALTPQPVQVGGDQDEPAVQREP
jgi:prophage regulatory protein